MEEPVKKIGTEYMKLNMGPSHPATHGTVMITLEIDGERVVKADTEIGYLHRAFEKMCESGTYTQAIPYTDRLNYVSPLINSIGYIMTVEKLIGIDVSERCKYIRVIMSEISRIIDHLTCIGASVMELGAFTPFLYLMQAREFLYELVEDVTGGRITPCYPRVGGLSGDLSEGFDIKTKGILSKTRELLKDVGKLLTDNRIFIDRMRGIGIISKEDAISYGITGPFLRSTGIPYDVRKAQPYLIYDRMDFDIPIGTNGDSYDRYLVRMEELEQSMRIVEQALNKIPDGPINVDDWRYILPPKEEVYTNIEGLMNHFKLIMEGIKVPKGEVYFAVEGGNGELGFYIVSDGSSKPYKLRVRPPCFPIMSAFSSIIEGLMIADIVPTFGSVNMIGGELDR